MARSTSLTVPWATRRSFPFFTSVSHCMTLFFAIPMLYSPAPREVRHTRKSRDLRVYSWLVV